VHPPPSKARANFTLMTECTPESSGCYSVYSVALIYAEIKGLLSRHHHFPNVFTSCFHIWKYIHAYKGEIGAISLLFCIDNAKKKSNRFSVSTVETTTISDNKCSKKEFNLYIRSEIKSKPPEI
jgi:hypothetical protein